jgi:NAD-dependent oxidoreductase involved in siderophore biosynthesis
MTVEDQIKLTRQQAFFKPVMVKALNQASEQLMTSFQVDANRTKKIHDKLYEYALAFSKRCTVTEQEFSSCIANLLDDEVYIDPETQPNEATTALYNAILANYQASFIQGGASVYPSWIERMANYVLGDEDLKL